MSNRLFVSFEFNRPDRTYDRVVFAIKSIDASCTEVHFAHWHVNTQLSAQKVCERLKPLLDGSDKLIVIDATNNEVAWANLSENAAGRLRGPGI